VIVEHAILAEDGGTMISHLFHKVSMLARKREGDVTGYERYVVAPLLRPFGETPIDQIDQQAVDRAATAIRASFHFFQPCKPSQMQTMRRVSA
jgi:hypothetical protein